MTVDRGVQPGVRQQAAQALDVSRRLASLERAAGSGGGGGGGGIPEAPLDGQQYGRQSGAWTVVDSSGSVWHVGSGAPAVGLGANGDFYLDEATGDVYEKSSGVWSLVANIRGPQGEQGEQGIQGEQGQQGEQGVPGDPGADGLGWTGGSYDDSDGTVTFTSDDGLGFSTGDLRGSDGDPGVPGTPGVDGLGWTGGSYDDATGIVEFTSDDGLGFSTDDLRGAPGDPGSPGDPGTPGADGKGWTGGTYDPATGTVTFTSNDGLEFTTGDLRGADGIDGLDGATWHVGSGDPDPTLGEDGDYYLDGDAGWVWIKRSSGWTNLYVNLTGPPGPGIEDAPSDGDQYARQDGAWTVVTGGGGLTWPLLAPDGTVTAPSYSFAADANTGLYLATAGDVRLAVGGSDVIGFDDRYITLGGQQQGVGRLSILVGTAGTPVYGFEGDVGTGMYRAAAASLGFSTGGAERVTIGSDLAEVSTSLKVGGTLTAKAGGGATNVAIGFDGITGMGIYSSAANNWLRFAVAGAQRLNIREDKVIVNNDLQVDGTITTGPGKAVNFGGNWDGAFIANTTASGREYMNIGQHSGGGARVRLYGPGDASYPGNAYIYGGGSIAARFDNAQNTKLYGDLQVDGLIKAANGTRSAPSIAFASDTDTGIHRAQTDVIELVVGGQRAAHFGKSNQGTEAGAWIPGINYKTGVQTANVWVHPDAAQEGALFRSTSSRSIMAEVEAVSLDATDRVGELRPVWFRSLADGDDPAQSHYGLAAEDVAAIDPRLATYITDEDGNTRPDDVNYRAVTSLLVAEVQRQRTEIATLAATVEALTARIETLENDDA